MEKLQRNEEVEGKVDMKGRETRSGCKKIDQKNDTGNRRQKEQVPKGMAAFQ